MWERILRIYAPSVTVAVLSCLSIEDIRFALYGLIPRVIRCLLPIHSHIWAQLALSAVVVLYAFIYQGPKYRRFQEHEKSLPLELANHLDSLVGTTSLPIRANIMLLRRTLFCTREPLFGKNYLRKPRVFCRIFVLIAKSSNCDHDADLATTFTTNQGVCGTAYRSRKATFRDLRNGKSQAFNLTKRQLKLSEEVKYVISFPIRNLDAVTSRPGDRIIGMVNIDTTHDHVARNLARRDSELRTALKDKAQTLSLMCTKLFVR